MAVNGTFYNPTMDLTLPVKPPVKIITRDPKGSSLQGYGTTYTANTYFNACYLTGKSVDLSL